MNDDTARLEQEVEVLADAASNALIVLLECEELLAAGSLRPKITDAIDCLKRAISAQGAL